MNLSTPEDYYAVLGVLPSIEQTALAAVYNVLIRKYHPDVYSGDKMDGERMAKKLNAAYEVLGDGKKRAEYDMIYRLISDGEEADRGWCSSQTVLVVDDDAVQAEEVAEYLNEHGITAYSESNPERAVAEIKGKKPALVIIDVNMPNLDGVRVAEILRSLNYGGSILLMSGDLDAVRRANQAGIDVFGVLPKPIPLKALERYARATLGRR